MDITEAEDIKRRQQYGRTLHKDLHDPDNHDGVITHLEPDILECEVKWALGSITMNKANRGDGISVELFQYASKSGKLSSGHRTGKGQFSFQSQRKECQEMLKLLPHNCTHLTRYQTNAQNSLRQASTVHEPRTSRCSSWV